MDFIINNPNVPQNMFPGQPNNMPMYQNPQYTFNNFETKKVILFYSASNSTSTADGLITTNTIYTSGGSTIMYNASGEPSSSASWSSGSFVSASYGQAGIFKFTLVEPLQVDRMSDVYLDNITLCNARINASISPATYGVALKINEIQQKTVSNNQTLNAKELIVINSQPSRPATHQPTFYESKNKKYNFLGVIPPGQYKELNGVLCDIEERKIKPLSDSFAFTIELIISNQK